MNFKKKNKNKLRVTEHVVLFMCIYMQLQKKKNT